MCFRGCEVSVAAGDRRRSTVQGPILGLFDVLNAMVLSKFCFDVTVTRYLRVHVYVTFVFFIFPPPWLAAGEATAAQRTL